MLATRICYLLLHTDFVVAVAMYAHARTRTIEKKQFSKQQRKGSRAHIWYEFIICCG